MTGTDILHSCMQRCWHGRLLPPGPARPAGPLTLFHASGIEPCSVGSMLKTTLRSSGLLPKDAKSSSVKGAVALVNGATKTTSSSVALLAASIAPTAPKLPCSCGRFTAQHTHSARHSAPWAQLYVHAGLT